MDDLRPADYLHAPLAYLRQAIASSSAWQTWCGAGEDALAHTGTYGVSGEKPWAVIGWGDGLELDRVGLGGAEAWDLRGGEIVLALSDRAERAEGSGAADEAGEMIAYLALVGSLLEELGQLVDGRHGYVLNSISMDEAPIRTREERRHCHEDTITSVWILDVQAQGG